MKTYTNTQLSLEIITFCQHFRGAEGILSSDKYTEMLEKIYEGETLRSYIEKLVSIKDSESKEYLLIHAKFYEFLSIFID